jgi:hypothetical protein
VAKITLYLDEATRAIVDRAAKAHGSSKSRWVAEVIRRYATRDWPAECSPLAGRFRDFPLSEGLASSASTDVERIGF